MKDSYSISYFVKDSDSVSYFVKDSDSISYFVKDSDSVSYFMKDSYKQVFLLTERVHYLMYNCPHDKTLIRSIIDCLSRFPPLSPLAPYVGPAPTRIILGVPHGRKNQV